MTLEHSERLASAHRLRSSQDFGAIKGAGIPIRGRHCLLLVLPRQGEITKVGFIASKRGVGGAVQRNRARRRIREIVRRRWSRIPHAGLWLAFVAFRSAVTTSHHELVTDVERVLVDAGAWTPVGGR